MSEHENGWNEWSKHVLIELERLNSNYSGLRDEINIIKADITKIKGIQAQINELKTWKNSVDEVQSPTQMKESVNDIKDLKNFKTVAITVWGVVQFLTLLIIGFKEFIF